MAHDLTDRQRKFAHRVAAGHNPSVACRDVGFAAPNQHAYKLMRNPRVLAVIRERRLALLDGDMTSVALDTMKDLMTDKEGTPAATRYKAAEWTLKAGGYGAQDTQGAQEKDLTDMNADELAAAVNSGMQALGELAQSLQGHHVIDGSARQLIEVEADNQDDDNAEDDSFLS